MQNNYTGLYQEIFNRAIADYHVANNVFQPEQNPFGEGTLEFLLYRKCWIDTLQWHMEDEVRNPRISDAEGMKWKRMIDKSNQRRTDIVEQIDDYYFRLFSGGHILPAASINTESPAWAIDRLSILALKIFHMKEETLRKEAGEEHIKKCGEKLAILLQQNEDLSTAIDELLDDYKSGRKYMKVYRQVKMYNDPSLNPVLYEKKK